MGKSCIIELSNDRSFEHSAIREKVNKIRINHNSPVPLYYQLREQIRDNILSGNMEKSFRLSCSFAKR